jgi:hypothetical protein
MTSSIGNRIARIGLGALLALALGATGCLFNVGNGTIVPPTVGKQLIDLEQARKNQLITEEEYQKLRKQIMENGPAAEGAPKAARFKVDLQSEEPDSDPR